MTSETYEARAFKRVVREEKKDLTNPIGRYRKTNLIPRVLSPASRNVLREKNINSLCFYLISNS